MKKFVFAVLATLPLMTMVAYADNDNDDQIEASVYNDKNFGAVKQKAIETLQAQGYRVTDVDADEYRGKPSLAIGAYKNGQEYDIELLYPSLTVVKEEIDR